MLLARGSCLHGATLFFAYSLSSKESLLKVQVICRKEADDL